MGPQTCFHMRAQTRVYIRANIQLYARRHAFIFAQTWVYMCADMLLHARTDTRLYEPADMRLNARRHAFIFENIHEFIRSMHTLIWAYTHAFICASSSSFLSLSPHHLSLILTTSHPHTHPFSPSSSSPISFIPISTLTSLPFSLILISSLPHPHLPSLPLTLILNLPHPLFLSRYPLTRSTSNAPLLSWVHLKMNYILWDSYTTGFNLIHRVL